MNVLNMRPAGHYASEFWWCQHVNPITCRQPFGDLVDADAMRQYLTAKGRRATWGFMGEINRRFRQLLVELAEHRKGRPLTEQDAGLCRRFSRVGALERRREEHKLRLQANALRRTVARKRRETVREYRMAA